MPNIRKCPYKDCPHGRNVDIDNDEYVKIGNRYFHPDCFEKKRKASLKKKCAYSHCKHKQDPVHVGSDDCVEENGKYYHPDCLREKNDIAEIIDFWYKEIDKDVVFNQLRRVIDQLVYNRGVDAGFILYAIKKKAKYLNYPAGIFYAIGDKRLKADWKIVREAEKLKAVKKASEKATKIEPAFQYVEKEKPKWGADIFGGKV